MQFGKFRAYSVNIEKDRNLTRNVKCLQENVGYLLLAVVIMTTANGNHSVFYGSHSIFSTHTCKWKSMRHMLPKTFLPGVSLKRHREIEKNQIRVSGGSYNTVMRIIKLKVFPVPVRLHSGYGKLIFVIISPFFAKFKNVVHSLEPGETPSYLLGVSPGSKLCKTFLNIAKKFKTVAVRLRCGCGYIFNLL